MGQVVKRRSEKGEVTYSARVRKLGFAPMYATFSRKSDADAWVQEQERKIRLGIHLETAEAKKHTFAETLERYLREEKISGRQKYQTNAWLEELGPMFLASINEVRINEICAKWRHEGRKGKKLGHSALNRYLSMLSVIFKAARDWGWVRRNPVRDARRFKEPRGRIRFLSDDERERLLVASKADPYKPLYLIVVLALSTGMRREELLNIKWKDIDVATGTILLLKTKNDTPRRIAVRGLAHELLKAHAKVRRIDSDFVFPGEKDSPDKPCCKIPAADRHFDIRKPWERALEAAKIGDFRFHDLRHSCASYLAMNGASLLEVAEVLGHKTLQMVKRYSHFADSHTAKVVENMNKKIFG